MKRINVASDESTAQGKGRNRRRSGSNKWIANQVSRLG
jgi:hypothetical protein